MKATPFNFFAALLEISHKNQDLIHGFAIDSRKIKKGDLFFALPGNRVDGHAFLQEVALKGAVGAVVSKDYTGDSFGLSLLYVPDVLLGLQILAAKILEKRPTKVVAITGSLGKTTTKEFTATLLQSRYRVAKSPLSYNTQSTLPLSILMADENDEILVLEMGMTHSGDIKKLIAIAPPDIACLTTVAVQHACNFSDGLKGISREKASIFSHPKTSLNIFHHDMPFKEQIDVGMGRKLSFSLENKEADFHLTILENSVCVQTKEEKVEIPLILPMRPHYQNFLAACVIARSLDIPWSEIQKIAPSLTLPPMRFEKILKDGVLFINDAYNANPDAIKAALEYLPQAEKNGKKIAVLSEMNALGDYSEEGHAMVGKLAIKHVDLLLCLGKRCEAMKKIWDDQRKECRLFETKEDLAQALKQLVRPGDVVLVKGARAYALEEIFNY